MQCKISQLIHKFGKRNMDTDEKLMCYNGELRIELRQLLQENHQTAITCLASFAGILTLLITFVEKYPHQLAIVFLMLPVPFLAIWITFLGKLWAVATISKYLSEEIETRFDRTVGPDFAGWETHLTRRVSHGSRFIHQAFWPAGQGILIILPVLASLTAFVYVVRTKHILLTLPWLLGLSALTVAIALVVILTIVAVARMGLLLPGKIEPNKASETTSEPAPNACSSVPQG